MKPAKSKAPNLIAPLSLILLISICIISCSDDNKKRKGATEQKENPGSTFKMNCVVLTKAQIQNWVDSGWTAPGPNKINKLVFQFYTDNASGINNNMKLICYPGKSLTNVYVNGKSIMDADSQCKSVEISGPAIFSNNIQSFDDLKITKKDGTLENFDFIRLIPDQKYAPYINFKVEIVRNAKDVIEIQSTWPCPTFCQE